MRRQCKEHLSQIRESVHQVRSTQTKQSESSAQERRNPTPNATNSCYKGLLGLFRVYILYMSCHTHEEGLVHIHSDLYASKDLVPCIFRSLFIHIYRGLLPYIYWSLWINIYRGLLPYIYWSLWINIYRSNSLYLCRSILMRKDIYIIHTHTPTSCEICIHRSLFLSM